MDIKKLLSVSLIAAASSLSSFAQESTDIILDNIGTAGGTITFEYHEYTSTYKRMVVKGCNLAQKGSVIIPDYVTTGGTTYPVHAIFNKAFYENKLVTKVELPEKLNYIDNYAFYDCTNLEEINLPELLDDIHYYAFCGCNLKSVVIPNSVRSLGSSIFSINYNLESVKISNNKECTKIFSNSFYLCNLQELELPENIKTVQKQAFYGNKNLKKVICAATDPTSDSADDAFSQETYDNAILYVPEHCLATYKELPCWKNFKNIVGFNAVAVNDALEIDNTGTAGGTISCRISSVEDQEMNIYQVNLGASGSLNIPATVNIGPYDYRIATVRETSIYQNSKVKSIYFEDGGPSSIKKNGIRENSLLESIRFGEGLVEIGDYACYYDRSLTKILDLPSSLKTIGVMAFGGCNKITEVHCNATTPPEMTDDAFTSTTYENATLYVPDDAIEAYAAAEGWRNFKTVLGGVGATTIADAPVSDVYTIQGVRLGADITNLAPGIYIVRRGSKVEKIIKQ